MDALLTTFVAAALAEWGDKTQLVVAALAARRGKPVLIMLGLFLAALASNFVAAYAGAYVNDGIAIRAMTLLVALALLFGGIAGLFRRKPPSLGSGRAPLLVTAFVLCLAAELGDRSQFFAFAFAARFDSPALAAAGATAGIMVAAVPAILLGDRLLTAVPLRAIRYSVAGLFLIAGFITAMQALQLA
jgi:putative Ca2+/H+ antiporter (TMEM165/GDT1 family)